MNIPPLDAKICYNGNVFLNNGVLPINTINNCSWLSKNKFHINTNDPYFLNYYFKQQSTFLKLKFFYFVLFLYSILIAIYTNNIVDINIFISFVVFAIFFLILFVISFFEKNYYDRIFVNEMFRYYEAKGQQEYLIKQMTYMKQELDIYKEIKNFQDGNKVYFTICPYCGAGCDNNDKTCKYCGTSLLYNNTHEQTNNITKHDDIDKKLYKATQIKNEKFKKDMEIVKRYNDYINKRRKKK